MKMYPTPTQDSASERTKKYKQGGTPLPVAVQEEEKRMYPTPRSSGQENPETLIKRKGVKAAAQHNLTAAVKMYPTPTVGCEEGGEQSSRVERTKSGGFILRERQMLPTPTVNDSKNNGGISQQKAKERGYGVNLNGVVGGKLNPNFVEFLMGFPMDWTKVELTELKPSATQSSHKSQEN
jgi:DNA (cytosine-5)-methyltransferase 1